MSAIVGTRRFSEICTKEYPVFIINWLQGQKDPGTIGVWEILSFPGKKKHKRIFICKAGLVKSWDMEFQLILRNGLETSI